MKNALSRLPVRASIGRGLGSAARSSRRVLAVLAMMTCAVTHAVAADDATPTPQPVTPPEAPTVPAPAADPKPSADENPAQTPPQKAPLKPGELTADDQAVVNAAIARLKRDLLLECLLSPAEKKRLGFGMTSAPKPKGKTPTQDPAAAEPDRDTQLARALETAEKNLAESKGRLTVNLASQCGGLGPEALVGLALVKAGVSPNHPLIQQIWNDIQKAPAQNVYVVGVELMLVEAMLHSPAEDWPQFSLKRKNQAEFDKVAAWVNRVADDLLDSGSKGVWGYNLRDRRYHDHSVTQYAVLGLKAARLSGWQPHSAGDRPLWEAVQAHFLKAQEKLGPDVVLAVQTERQGEGGVDYTSEGWKKSAGVDFGYESSGQARGWSYTSDNLPGSIQPGPGKTAAYLNMTIAGLTAMILARSELASSPEQKPKKPAKPTASPADAVRDGMAWVQTNWAADVSDGYGLYGIERLGVLGNLTTIGGHDWYRELAPKAAARVMSKTKLQVHWGGLSCERAFYLLFLVRGTSSSYARPTGQGAAPQ